MYKLLGRFVARWWTVVIGLWIVVVVGFLGLTFEKSDVPPNMTLLRAMLPEDSILPKWEEITHDGDLAYLPDSMTTVRAAKLLEQAFPESESRSQMALVVAREDGPLTASDAAVINQLADVGRLEEIYSKLAQEQHLKAAEHQLPLFEIWTPNSDVVGGKLVSGDKQAAIVVLLLKTEFMAVQNMTILDAVQERINEIRDAAEFPAGLQLGVSGSAAIGGDMLLSARDSIQNTELWTVILVLAILALVYRAPVLVLIPLITIMMSVVVAINVVGLLTQANQIPGLEWLDFKVFKTTRIFVVTLLFGSGTDFCLFLISRYKEEIHRGLSRREALSAAVTHTGDAIVASAGTTIFGLAMMYFADFGKFRNSGPAIALCIVVALVACLTLAPALIRAFGWIVFWPFGASGRQQPSVEEIDENSSVNRFWGRIGAAIVRRPGLILIASVVLMSPLAIYGARPRFDEWDGTARGMVYLPVGTSISYNLVNELDANRPSVKGTKLLHEHFNPGEVGPLTMLVYQPDGEFNTPEGEKKIAALTKQLYQVEGVSSVRSLVEPLGDKPGGFRNTKKIAILKNPRVRKTFLTDVPALEGKVTRFDIAVNYDPFSAKAAAVLIDIDKRMVAEAADPQSPWHGAQFDFLGTTAGTRDLKAVTESDQRLIQFLVVTAVLAILLIILKRPVICLYLIASVLFSYFVTIGATELLFAQLYPNFEGLDWKVPIFLFVILIAVGQDYNIYLTTRVFEEQRRWGRMRGLERAVAQTGGIITSCGVIMAGTFVSMMSGTLKGMLELGFALTLGVVLDTFVVRPVLVPAFLAILFRREDQRELEEPGADTISALPHLAAKADRAAKRRAAGE